MHKNDQTMYTEFPFKKTSVQSGYSVKLVKLGSSLIKIWFLKQNILFLSGNHYYIRQTL